MTRAAIDAAGSAVHRRSRDDDAASTRPRAELVAALGHHRLRWTLDNGYGDGIMKVTMNAESNRDAIHKLIDELPERDLRAAKIYLESLKQSPEDVAARDKRDGEIINAHADELNAEAEDVLGYQAEW